MFSIRDLTNLIQTATATGLLNLEHVTRGMKLQFRDINNLICQTG